MEVSALKYSGGIGLHGRSALLRLQSDERLIAYVRRGNTSAFEVLVSRYESRLLAFCRHLLGSREDAEDVLQEVLTAAFNAILADERAINVRPWLYRIARNRSLNHLRRARAIGVDSMDTHFSDHGASTADKVHEREEFNLLVGDIHELPESQKTALVLREMDALSYEQIAEAMETTVPSVKSLLVRARVSLAEAAEARLLSCDEVRIELGEIAEGLRRRPSPLVRRHLRSCERCSIFRTQLKHTNKALAALMPIGPMIVLKKLAIFHLGHSAASGSGATAAAQGAAGASAGAAGAVAGGGAAAGSSVIASSGFMSAGIGALATKAAAGIAAAAIVTAGAVEADHTVTHHVHHTTVAAVAPRAVVPAQQAALRPVDSYAQQRSSDAVHVTHHSAATGTKTSAATKTVTTKTTPTTKVTKPAATINTPVNTKATPTGRNTTQTDPTVLPVPAPAPAAAPVPTTPTSPTPTSTDPSGTPTGTTTATTPTTTTDPPPPSPVTTPTPAPPVTTPTPPVPTPAPPVTTPGSTPPVTTPPTATPTPRPTPGAANSTLSLHSRLARSHAWAVHTGA